MEPIYEAAKRAVQHKPLAQYVRGPQPPPSEPEPPRIVGATAVPPEAVHRVHTGRVRDGRDGPRIAEGRVIPAAGSYDLILRVQVDGQGEIHLGNRQQLSRALFNMPHTKLVPVDGFPSARFQAGWLARDDV